MRRQSGFTLLEILIAIAILTVSVSVLALSWFGTVGRVEKTRILNNMASLLERKMAEVEAQYRGGPVSAIPEEDSGKFEDYPGYSWVLQSQEADFPDLSSIIVEGQGGASEFLLSVVGQLRETLNKATKEVRVTIKYETAKRPIEYWAATYFVDFDVTLSLPGMPGAGAGP